ncbi:MAG: futalosine hydrolase [Bacteroidetes bacterium]|nr:futalosine hydrolase [Bacteroidota bacterium]
MKKVLLVVATEKEADVLNISKVKGLEVTKLVTGPGMMATAFELGKVFSKNSYDLAINMGIAGSFYKALYPGKVVEVTAEAVTDIGAEDGDSFLSVFDLGLADKNTAPYQNGVLVNPTEYTWNATKDLAKVKGGTVNTIHGRDSSIRQVIQQFSPRIETMEGAAFFYACLKYNVPFIEIRSISNLIERRNKSVWKVDLALASLAKIWKEIAKEI